jgi:hypothetical protein
LSLYGWVLLAMLHWAPVHSLEAFAGYQRVAVAIDSAACGNPDDASLLAAIGAPESGYDIRARGKDGSGSFGVWQLLPLAPCTEEDVDCQAVEALRRAKEMGMASFTGEAVNLRGEWPLAHERLAMATIWTATHPFIVGPAWE